jgi:uncharacterized membrane protein YdjX (TVP38/TMEM64 family)
MSTTFPSSAAAVRRPRTGLRSLAPILGTLLLVVAAFATMVWLTSDPERQKLVQGLVQSPGGLLVLFALSAISTATLILPAPGLALTAVAGAAGDPIVVGIVTGLGQAVGELTGYFGGASGRSLLPDTAAIRKLSGWLQRRGMVVIFALAVIPNPVFDVAGIAAGALRMPLARYLAAAASGKIIKNIVVAGGAATILGLAVLASGSGTIAV